MSGVSVIIPTCNRACVITRALASVYAQTRAPDEVIVVDDGSVDNTEAIVRDGFPNARYLYQPNSGVSAARNAGIRAAAGEWIALLDSDDEWLPDKLQRQLQLADGRPEHPLIHTDEIWIRNGVRVNQGQRHRKQGGYIFRHCLPLCVISPSAVMIRRELFDSIGMFDESLPACEDYELWLRICARYPVAYLEEPLIIKYGGHEDQLSRRYWGMDRFRIRALHKILQGGHLNNSQREMVIATMIQKLEVYLNGARKRRNPRHVEEFQRLQTEYSPA